jgi:acyl-coenzyme A synthetase/AMP-(fatty) acid ligase
VGASRRRGADEPADDGGRRRDLAARVAATCAEQLARFKQPREIYIVDDLPRSTLEKVAKPELRRRVRQGTVSSDLPAS